MKSEILPKWKEVEGKWGAALGKWSVEGVG